MAGIWLCADCHSANRDGAQRCYKCRAPRASGELREATLAMATAGALEATAHLAAAARTGARYRPTWMLAAMFVALSSVSAAAQARLGTSLPPLVSASATITASNSQWQQLMDFAIWVAAATLAGTLVWAFWIALVVSNVPALTARWTPHTALGAFVSVWVPILSLKRPYTIVRNVLRILFEDRPGPALVALLWWLTFLGSTFGSSLVVLYAAASGRLEPRATIILAIQVRVAFFVLTTVLGAVVVVIVELGQRRAARTRSAIVRLAQEAPTAG